MDKTTTNNNILQSSFKIPAFFPWNKFHAIYKETGHLHGRSQAPLVKEVNINDTRPCVMSGTESCRFSYLNVSSRTDVSELKTVSSCPYSMNSKLNC